MTDETTVPIEKYREVLSKLEAKDAECKRLTEQVKDDQYMLEKFSSDAAIEEKAQKDEAIETIFALSKGKITKESLVGDSLSELNKQVKLAHEIAPKSFISVMREHDEEMRKPRPSLGTVGTYNQATGKYEGGIEA